MLDCRAGNLGVICTCDLGALRTQTSEKLWTVPLPSFLEIFRSGPRMGLTSSSFTDALLDTEKDGTEEEEGLVWGIQAR